MIFAVLIGLVAGPLVYTLIRDHIKVKKMEQEYGKLQKIEEIEQKYGVTISETSLKMK